MRSQGRTQFVDVSELGQIETGQAIFNRGVDVLVDLSGPTRYNRLGALCMTPAPVCVAGMGYAIPYRIPILNGFFTDRYCHVEPMLERRLELASCASPTGRRPCPDRRRRRISRSPSPSAPSPPRAS